MARPRRGLTLIEVVISILIFAIGALGLAASAASITRQISASTIRSRGAAIARTRVESAQALPCAALSNGESVMPAIKSRWTFSPGTFTTLDHEVERTDAHGVHTDRFLAAVPCS